MRKNIILQASSRIKFAGFNIMFDCPNRNGDLLVAHRAAHFMNKLSKFRVVTQQARRETDVCPIVKRPGGQFGIIGIENAFDCLCRSVGIVRCLFQKRLFSGTAMIVPIVVFRRVLGPMSSNFGVTKFGPAASR